MTQRTYIIAILGLLTLAYLSAIIFEYGYNDDYHFITRANNGKLLPFNNEIYDDGRPVMSLLYSGMFRCIDTVSDLRWIRLSSLAALLVLAVYLYRLLLKWLDPWRATLATLIACATPPTGILVGWAAGGIHNWLAVLLAMMAGDVWLRATENRKYILLSGCLILLLLAMCTYQPSASFFFLPLLIRLWGQRLDKAMFIRLVAATASFFVVGIAYLLLVRYVLVGQSTRVDVSIDIAQKLQVLFDKMLLPSLESWAVFYPNPVAWSVAGLLGLFMVLGLFFRARELHWLTALAHLCWVGLFVGATLGPSMIAAQSYPVYRSQLGLYFATGLLLAFGLFACADYFMKRSKPVARLFQGMSVAVCIVYLLCSAYHLFHGMVWPNHREYTYVRNAVHDTFDAIPSAMVYYRPPHEYSSDGIHHNVFEYGVITSPNEHVTSAFLENMFREKFVLITDDESERMAAKEAFANMKAYTQPMPDADHPIIDGFRLVTGQPVGERVDAYWGPVKEYSNGWLETDWFGRFDNSDFPYIYHDHFGWIYCDNKSPKGEFIFNVISDGYILTTPEFFPSVYRLSDGHAIGISFEITHYRWYYDYTDQKAFFVRANYWQKD